MKVAIVSLFVMACVLSDNFSEVQGNKMKCTNPTGHDGESQTEGCLKKTCKNGVWRPSLEQEVCCFNNDAFTPNTTITVSKDEYGCTMASIECRYDGNKARLVLSVNSTLCSTVEQQLEEVKQLLEEHMDTTDKLASSCQMDSTLATTDSDTTTATTTTTTTTDTTEATQLYSSDNYSYYKVTVDYGTQMVTGTVADTCERIGMKAVCDGPSGCKYKSDRCRMTPLSTDCGNTMFPLSKLICNGKTAYYCPLLDGMFGDMSNWYGSELGYVDGEGVM